MASCLSKTPSCPSSFQYLGCGIRVPGGRSSSIATNRGWLPSTWVAVISRLPLEIWSLDTALDSLEMLICIGGRRSVQREKTPDAKCFFGKGIDKIRSSRQSGRFRRNGTHQGSPVASPIWPLVQEVRAFGANSNKAYKIQQQTTNSDCIDVSAHY